MVSFVSDKRKVLRAILDFTIAHIREESKEVPKILHFRRQDMRGILF